MIGYINLNNRILSEESKSELISVVQDTYDDQPIVTKRKKEIYQSTLEVDIQQPSTLEVDIQQPRIPFSLKKGIAPSYFHKNILDNALFMRYKYDVNSIYRRTRRLNSPSSKLRVGPVYVTADNKAPHIIQKPGQLRLCQDFSNNHAVGILMYFSSISNNDLNEIDLNFVISILDVNDVIVNMRDEYGQTILFAAVRDWHQDVTQFLIDNKADVNASDKFGRTPLHLASALNCIEVVKVLLRNGADPNHPTLKEHQTPVHYAAKYDSPDTLKELLAYGGSFTERDHMDRSPLFVSAHRGCDESSRILLECGAPCFIIDKKGDSIISGMIEKLPNVAAIALDQFMEKGKHSSHLLLYVNQLENTDPSNDNIKSPLELISLYKDHKLIMHPIIQKSISIKWRLFGRRRSILELILSLFNMACWFLLSYTTSDDIAYYYNDNGVWHYAEWKIAFEILVVLIPFFYFFRTMFNISKGHIEREKWKEEKKKEILRKYIYCHPAWPEERNLMARQEEILVHLPYSNKRYVRWFVYDCAMLVLIGGTVLSRVLALIYETNTTVFLAYKVIFCGTMVFSAVRVLKVLTTFPYVSEVFCACSYLGKPLLQMLVLFLQLYVPFVAFKFNMQYEEVHNHDSNATLSNHTISFKYSSNRLTPLFSAFSYLFKIMFTFQENISFMDKSTRYEDEAFISIYHLLLTFLLHGFLIANITSHFKTIRSKCIAEASLLRAEYLVGLQKSLSLKNKKELATYYREHYNPILLFDREATLKVTLRDLKTLFSIFKEKIEKISHELKEFEKSHGVERMNSSPHDTIMDTIGSHRRNIDCLTIKFSRDLAKTDNLYRLLESNIEQLKKFK